MKKYIIITMIFAILASLLLVSCGNISDPNSDSESTNDKTEVLEFSNTPSEGLEFSMIDEKTCKITGIGTCTDTMVHIPSEINGLIVTEVRAGYSWQRKEPIKGIMIPDSVTKISTDVDRSYGFSKSLEKIILPETPISFTDTEIIFGGPIWGDPNDWTDGALYFGSHLIRVRSDVKDTFIIRDGTVDVARAAFYSSAATHVIIPDSVVMIDQEAFMHCEALNRVTIGSGVEYIGESAFYNCDVLRKIAYAGSETQWQSIEKNGMRGGTTPTNYEVIYNWSDTETETNNKTNNVSGTTDPKYFTFILNEDNASYKAKVNKDYIGAVTEYHIPAEYEGLPVTAVGSFGGLKNVTVITMPDSVTSVDAFAWGNNEDLTTVRLSSNLQVLPENLCMGCEKLNNVVIPASVTQIDAGAFGGCTSLSDIKYNGTVEQWSSIVLGQWWISGYVDSTPTDMVTCSNGVAKIIIHTQVTEDEWNNIANKDNLSNVTINVSADFSEGMEPEDSAFDGEIKIATDFVEVYGQRYTETQYVSFYKNLYADYITNLIKVFNNFEYDIANNCYISDKEFWFEVTLTYPGMENYTETAEVTASNVIIELDDSKQHISKITLAVTHDVSENYSNSSWTYVLKAVLTFSDYGTTNM